MYSALVSSICRMMPLGVTAVGLVLFTHSAQSECSGHVSTQMLQDRVDAVETSFQDEDIYRVRSGLRDLDDLLPCTSETIPQKLVGAIHRTYGIKGFIDQDRGRMRAAMRGARVADRDHPLSEVLFPTGHPIRLSYDNAVTVSGASTWKPAKPYRRHLVIDGYLGGRFSDLRASLVQQVSLKGEVLGTYYVWPGERLSPYRTNREVLAPILHIQRAAGSSELS